MNDIHDYNSLLRHSIYGWFCYLQVLHIKKNLKFLKLFIAVNTSKTKTLRRIEDFHEKSIRLNNSN